MVEMRVYLTQRQRGELDAVAGITGKKRSELVRKAVEHLTEWTRERRGATLREAAGMRRDRAELPDFRAMRGEPKWRYRTSRTEVVL